MTKKTKAFLNSTFISIWLILLALILRWSVLEVYIMPLQGMMPTLFVNDHVIVNKLSYGLRAPFLDYYISHWSRPKRGDVVVFRAPFDTHSLSIRRVIGLPGDRIFFENGNLYVNEQQIAKQIPFERKKDFSWVRDEDFSDEGRTEDKSHYVHWEETLSDHPYSILLKKEKKGYLIFGPYRIPPRYYFVMGDHRDYSQDSRTWPARIQKAKGKVTFSRSHTQSATLIPKGTLVRTSDVKLPEYFETEKEVQLKGLFVDVEVTARKAGLAGNVPIGQINVIEGPLSKELSVSNAEALTGGKDENLVFELDILGRVSRIWFSCEKTLTKLSILCDPRYIRWDRTFFSIYH
ncbi:MAG: signal peptidase I [Oligoflexia bacterium]|nr:signal peptidase I [Bdellovibrionales bacterium]MYE07352.1 signal peptidase I [Oligoflexia bacterium]